MRRSWTLGLVVAVGIVGIVGIVNPAVALRAAVILCVVVAAFVLVDALRRLFDRIPPVPDPVRRPDGSDTAAFGTELSWHYAGLVPSDTPSPMLAPRAQAALRTIATERLWERHGLNLWHRDHGGAIGHVLTASLWTVLNPFQPTPPDAELLRHARLAEYLDELESL